MSGLTDFQVAMVVLGLLVLIMGFAVFGRGTRGDPGAPRISDRQSTDAIGADVGQLKTQLGRHDGRLGEVENRLGEVEHHLAQVRTMLGALPSKDAVHRIALEVADIRGDLKVNSTETLATARAVERIERILMERDTK